MITNDIGILMDRYARLCWKIASQYAPFAGEQDLEEIVADVFIDYWRNSDRYDSEKASVKKYLAGIARNKAVDFSRKYRILTELPDTIESGGADPAECLERQETNETLAAAMSTLTTNEQDILWRRYVDGEKPATIAQSLNLDIKQIKNTLYRAKNKLKNKLKGEL